MKNYIQPGANLTLAAPYDVVAGAGALVGTIFGVAQAAALTGEQVVLCRGGVYELAKTGSQSWTVGARIYWDDTNKLCTTTASGNTLIGAAIAAAGSADTTGLVSLNGTA